MYATMSEKRFQDCNKLEQLWRYRFYLAIPFMWLWYSVVGFKIGIDEEVNGEFIHTSKYEISRGKQLWRLLIGIQQMPMKWYYTSEEVFNKIKKYE